MQVYAIIAEEKHKLKGYMSTQIYDSIFANFENGLEGSLAVVGQSETRANEFLSAVALKDISLGRNVVFMDFYGDEGVKTLMENLSESEAEKVIYLDFADREKIAGLTILGGETDEEKEKSR